MSFSSVGTSLSYDNKLTLLLTHVQRLYLVGHLPQGLQAYALSIMWLKMIKGTQYASMITNKPAQI